MIEQGCSYGGGVQTFALMVMAEQGLINPEFFLFADTGAEHYETYLHIEKVAKPLAQKMGIPFHTIRMSKKVDDISLLGDKEIEDYKKMLAGSMKLKTRSERIRYHRDYNTKHNIPRKLVTSLRDEIVARRRVPSINPQSRWCTSDAKLIPIYRDFIRPRQKSGEIARPCQMLIGLSYDELTRMYRPHLGEYRVKYPLIDMKLTRIDCVRIIERSGYSMPPKSGCYFCPFQPKAQWGNLLMMHPDQYWDSVQLEEMDLNFPDYRLNANDGPLRKLAPYFSKTTQKTLEGNDHDEMTCEQAGYCNV